MAKWLVGGVNKVRGNFVTINDTVQGTDDSGEAHEKARKKYPRAPELNVRTKGKNE